MMNIDLAVMDRPDITKRSSVKGVKLPIIALTAYTLKSNKEKGLAAGFSEYLAKPLDLNKIREVIDKHLSSLL